jgi:hypothetical protein
MLFYGEFITLLSVALSDRDFRLCATIGLTDHA